MLLCCSSAFPFQWTLRPEGPQLWTVLILVWSVKWCFLCAMAAWSWTTENLLQWAGSTVLVPSRARWAVQRTPSRHLFARAHITCDASFLSRTAPSQIANMWNVSGVHRPYHICAVIGIYLYVLLTPQANWQWKISDFSLYNCHSLSNFSISKNMHFLSFSILLIQVAVYAL